jgi:hypothetical protein
MKTSRFFTRGLIVLTVVAIVALSSALSAGAVLAQGPGNGRGAGAGGAGGYGLTLQLQAPTVCLNCTAGTAAGTGLQYGARNRYGQNGAAGGGLGLYALTATGELTPEAIDALTAGLADEINAYAVYGQIIAQFGAVVPFSRIQQAEASHIAALEAAFTRYGLPVPEVAPSVAMSASSLADACALGAQAEVANFALYDQWIAPVSAYPALVQVFTNLRNASEFSHLPAFQACAG